MKATPSESLEPDFTLDGSAHWEALCIFEGGLHAWRGDQKSNDLHVVIAIPAEYKYEAMQLTDNPGKRLRVKVDVLSFDGFEAVKAVPGVGDGNDEAKGDTVENAIDGWGTNE